ncbi:hypothetical protein [Chitinophaga flava]|uniref:Uncharacterized protein n=1 Tax=Chitinophaga flava TaxID=2259036 RepID=A0A365Y1A1_9BACT|nr:hypothetical protein [Chitinophaga flava]RBL92377.1 hypothetical protein DF182_07255 [Chitinophaga flava]
MLKVEFLGEEGIRVNGVLDKEAGYNDHVSGTFSNPKVIDLLSEYSFEELASHFNDFFIEKAVDVDSGKQTVSYYIYLGETVIRKTPLKNLHISIDFDFEASLWAKPWSVLDFSSVFASVLEKLKTKYCYYQSDTDDPFDGFGIKYDVEEKEMNLGICLAEMTETMQSAWNKTEEILQSKLDKDKLITYFHFPSSVKTACKQYLIYFTQFLSDLGIEAETEIEEKGGTTMLKVIPENKEEALSQIREALAVYLAIPGSQEFDELSGNMYDISLAQLRANVLHLKSQWEMAKALLQMKDATIGQLQLCNYQYKQLLDGHAMTPKTAEEEDLIEGVLTVTKYKGDAFTINLPEILRKIKRKLK